MTGPTTAAPSSWTDRLADRLLFAWIVAFAAVAVVFAFAYPFGHAFDEIEHWSMIVALWQRPTLFPDYGTYRVLALDLSTWTDQVNYLAHPPLYYLTMGPITALFPGDARPVRLADAALVIAGLAVAARAGARHFAIPADRKVFRFLVFGLSASCGIAGLVNNDALLIFEFGLLFALLADDRRRPLALGIVVAAIGWTKFNGFVAALALVALLRLFETAADRRLRPTRADVAVVLGAAVGAIPTLVCLARVGRPVWSPETFPDWFDHVRPEIAASLAFADFAGWFFRTIGHRFFADGGVLGLSVGLLALLGLALVPLAPTGPGRRPGEALARAGVVMLAVYAGLHLVYAYGSMRGTGSMVEAQARYYVAPWIPLAFAVAFGLARLPARLAPVARAVVVAVVVAASVPMSLAIALVAPADRRAPSADVGLLAPAPPLPPTRPPGPAGDGPSLRP